MDLRTVLLFVCVVILQFVLCLGLKKTDPGATEIVTKKEVLDSLLFKDIRGPGKKTRCPKGYKICKDEDLRGAAFDPKIQICCAKKKLESVTNIICRDGWAYDITQDICQPQCKSCENGYCVEPNICQCEPPLILENENQCVMPKCDPVCVNSFCINNTCECDIGFERINSTHCAALCEPGFIHNLDTLNCIPECESPCLNATCTSPNTCTCDVGYKPSGNNTCVPDCTEPCINGFCSLPNECSCVKGYLKNTTNLLACYKPCAGPCDNGTCTEHGECFCKDGFQLTNGTCSLVLVECSTCDGNCTSVAGKPCLPDSVQSEAVSPALAGLTWIFFGVVVLLVVLLLVVIHRTWRKRREYETKTADECNQFSSVIYTIPNTLIQKNIHEDYLDEEDEYNDEEKKTTNEPLLDAVTNDVLSLKTDTH